jgi:hypothetical protein
VWQGPDIVGALRQARSGAAALIMVFVSVSLLPNGNPTPKELRLALESLRWWTSASEEAASSIDRVARRGRPRAGSSY